MDNYKEASHDFYNELINFSRGKIINEEDINRILELSFKENKMKELEQISFYAKFTKGLLRIIQNKDNNIEDEYFEKVKKEYSENIQKVKSGVEVIISSGSNFIQEIFREKYFQLTHESLSNLNNLCSDLEWIKMYFNSLKERNN